MHECFKNIDYNNCITNLTSSIQKHFGLEPFYATNQTIDKILEENDYDNVIIILFDGMGKAIIEKNTCESHFLRKNLLTTIKSTYPPTTANCTTSFLSGLNPISTSWLGWSTYYRDLNIVIDNFPNRETYYQNVIEGENIALSKMPYTELGKLIEQKSNGKVKYHSIWPSFGKINACKNLREFRRTIIRLASGPNKKYMYAYWNEPDTTMHIEGTKNKKVAKILDNIAYSLEVIQKKCKNTLCIVVADHGQIDINPTPLYQYYDIVDCLKAPYSCDSRTSFFFVKEGKEECFKELFNKYFKDKFYLFSKQEIINMGIFGKGKESPMYQNVIGDFVSIAKDDNYFLLSPNSRRFKGGHAGTSLDEMEIPIIIIKSL